MIRRTGRNPQSARNVRHTISKLNLNHYIIQERMARRGNTVAYMFGILFLFLSISLLAPLIVAYSYGDDLNPWIYPLLITTLLSIPLLLRFQPADVTRPTEALFVVTNAWLMAMVFGAIPYVMYGMGIVDALFETMSGFTTTGSTIMFDIESWPKSLLFWRSMTQWLGGAGIILVFVTIFPMLGVVGRTLARREFSGIDVRHFTRRVQEESMKFHYIFIGLSVIQLLLLLLTGIGIYDSLTIMFSTLSTGGFSPYGGSISHYNSVVIEWIVIIFMFLAGVNFYLHFQAIRARDRKAYWRNSEFRTYTIILVAASLVGSIILWMESHSDILRTVTDSTFQMVSMMSSTGFATVDFPLWNGPLLFILFLLTAIGGSTGSTAGGMKVVRIVLVKRFISNSVYKIVHPKAIFSIKLDSHTLTENALTSMMAIIFCYMITVVIVSASLIFMGLDPSTAISASISSVSNAGPALGELGPFGTYGGLSDLAKVVLIFAMWAGRLEFLTVFALLTPVFWRELTRYRRRE
ncbi:MAG: TrkH family potassium uptake protein [Euryarchaeota archaeon]|nr:TrkH family potassium uptake protein [Euryarchaeota archaeon]